MLAFAMSLAMGVQVTFEAKELANLTAHLDCLAGVRRCNRKAYVQFWQKELGWTTEDERRMDEWRAAVRDVGIDWTTPTPRPDVTYPLPARALDPQKSVRVAGLQATSLTDYEDRLDLMIEPKAIGRLKKFLELYQPRFSKLWTRVQPDLDKLAKAATAQMREKQITAFVDKVAKFYGAELPAQHTVHMSLVYRPKAASRLTTSEQLAGFAVVEAVDGESIRLDVVMHELFHYFYEQTPDSVHADIMDTLAKSAMSDAFSAFAIMNEAFATAMGNGVVARMLSPKDFDKWMTTPRGLYNDDVIDKAAKAALPLVDAWVERGEELSGAKVEVYRAAMAQAFGPQLRSLGIALRQHYVAYTGEGVKALLPKLVDALKANSQFVVAPMDSPDALKEFFGFRDVNGVLLMTKAEAPRLKAWEKYFGGQVIDRIRELSGIHAGFVYGVRRTDKAITYVLVGEDADTIEALFPKLAAVTEPFTGVGPLIGQYTK